jgi:hypothetical protein
MQVKITDRQFGSNHLAVVAESRRQMQAIAENLRTAAWCVG